MTERPLNITEADLRDWPWLRVRVEERDGEYHEKRDNRPHGDPGFRLHDEARRLDVRVRCIDGSIHIDIPEFRRRVEQHHWLRSTEGFRWCPECGCDLSQVDALPPSISCP